MTRAADISYEEYRERLEAWIRKNAQRGVLKARRVEREQVQQLGGGKKITELIIGPAKRKSA